VRNLLLVLLTVSTVSFAKGRIGEWAAYDYTEKTEKSEIKGQLIKEIIEAEDKKLPTGEKVTVVKVSEKLILNGRAGDETNLFTKFELNLYVQLCRFQKSLGSYEKINVKAGKFGACKIKDQESWIGAVPFSTLLYMTNDGTTFKRFELINYGWKKKD
jgi:hypothetical protein